MSEKPAQTTEIGTRAPRLKTEESGMHCSRQGLDRGEVIRAAVELIDRDGLRLLTMRKISEHLQVPTGRLSRLFGHRDELLDAIADAFVDELPVDPDFALDSCDWQDYLQHLAHSVRRAALAHPQVFPLIATRPPAAPWLQPPLRSLQWMEEFLETLHRCGFSDPAAVAAYRGFGSFLLGHLLLEVSAHGADPGPIEEADPREPRAEDLAGYPRLQSMRGALLQGHSDDEFEESLEALLDRLETIGLH
jgi:AcrR family transcriptional regulator